ncbi:MAG: hypothetical protein ACLTVE_01485 [Clostridia bacterium]
MYKAQINEALNTENPMILNHLEICRPWYYVAGIACAGGNISSRYGVAPESQ